MGVKFETSWGLAQKNFNYFQNHTATMIFWKNDLQLEGPRGYFWGIISGLIFFEKKFKGISFVKFAPSLKMNKFFKGISNVKCEESFLKGFLL